MAARAPAKQRKVNPTLTISRQSGAGGSPARMPDLLSFDPRLQRFFAYWDERRRGRAFPTRHDLDPADIPFILGYVTLVEVLYEPLRFRFRLHGSELVRRGGYDMTGKGIEDLPGEENRQAFLERCLSLLQSRQPQLVRSARPLDGRMLRFEAVWVPLSDDGETINMLMRALIFSDASRPGANGSLHELHEMSALPGVILDDPTGAITAPLDQNLLAAAQDEGNRQFIAAWQGWRGPGRLLPKRSAVELGDIKQLLGRVILLELVSDGEILVRVAGSALRQHTDFEATGKNLRDLTPAEQWRVRLWRTRAAASRPCGARMINIGERTPGGEGAAFETVTLPIEPDDAQKPPLLMSNIAILPGKYTPPAKVRSQDALLPDQFAFLDLGAGVPDRIEP
jgi:hypothetical protein